VTVGTTDADFVALCAAINVLDLNGLQDLVLFLQTGIPGHNLSLTAVVDLLNCLVNAHISVNLTNLLNQVITILSGPTPGCVACLISGPNALTYAQLHALFLAVGGVVHLQILNINDLCSALGNPLLTGLGLENILTHLGTGLSLTVAQALALVTCLLNGGLINLHLL
jgi:hypothetical protein